MAHSVHFGNEYGVDAVAFDNQKSDVAARIVDLRYNTRLVSAVQKAGDVDKGNC